MKSRTEDPASVSAALFAAPPLAIRLESRGGIVERLVLSDASGSKGVVAAALPADPLLSRAAQEILHYLSGSETRWTFPYAPPGGTPWQRAVWAVLETIPFGQVQSYAWVAGRLGKPRGARAVGQAVARNPLPLIIPCHRVVAGDGTLGGFSSGTAIKRYLLRLEGHRI